MRRCCAGGSTDRNSLEMTTALKITREPGGWVDRLRAYQVCVNGKERAEIRAGEQRVLDVSSGPVEVLLKLDFCRSRIVRLDVAEGDEPHLHCGPRSWITMLYGITFGRNNYMHLRIQSEDPVT